MRVLHLFRIHTFVCKPGVGGFCGTALGYFLWQVKDIVGYLQVFQAVSGGIAVVVIAIGG